MLISSKVHNDYKQTNTKVINSQFMINMLATTSTERSQNVGTVITIGEHSDNILQTLCVSWVTASAILPVSMPRASVSDAVLSELIFSTAHEICHS